MGVMVVAAFTGVGKSTFAKENPSVADEDSFKFDKTYFPGNLMCAVRNHIVEDRCSLVSTHEIVRDALNRNDIDFILVYPGMECKDEFIKRYRERGSELKYIDLIERNWESWIQECEAQEGCTHVVLKPGQYLSDVIRYDETSKEFDVIKPEPSDYPQRDYSAEPDDEYGTPAGTGC